MEKKEIKKEDEILINSPIIDIKPHQRYLVHTRFLGIEGMSYSAYLCVIIFDSENEQIVKCIRWLNDFSGEEKDYKIIFTAPSQAKFVSLGYRINNETPVKSDMKVRFTPVLSLKLEETNELEDSFDDLTKFKIPKLKQLTESEEEKLEKNMVFILAMQRSGTTWLATRLLNHEGNIIWNEPHLAWLWTGR